MLKAVRHIGQLFARSNHGLRQALCKSCLHGRRWAIASSSTWILASLVSTWFKKEDILEAPAALRAIGVEAKVGLTFQAHPANIMFDLQAVPSGSWIAWKGYGSLQYGRWMRHRPRRRKAWGFGSCIADLVGGGIPFTVGLGGLPGRIVACVSRGCTRFQWWWGSGG